jgi:hypothetical protein
MKNKAVRQGLVRTVQVAALAAACIILLMAIAILKQLDAVSLDINKSLIGLPRQTYDILVRNSEGVDPLEARYGLVQSNHLNGINGGISFAQYELIKSLPEIEVAAPVAMIGYFPQRTNNIEFLDPLPMGLYRIDIQNLVQDGLTSHIVTLQKPYYAFYSNGFTDPIEDNLRIFELIKQTGIHPINDLALRNRFAFSVYNGNKNVLVAAIDPEQEAKLLGLDKVLTAGTYLSSEKPTMPGPGGISVFNRIPSLINTKNYLAQTIEVSLTRLEVAYDKKTSLIEQMKGLPAVQDLYTYPEGQSFQFSIPISGYNAAISSVFSIKDSQVISQRSFVSSLFGDQTSPSVVKYRIFKGKPEAWQGFEPVLEAIPQDLSRVAIIDASTYYCDTQVRTCPNNVIWQVPVELSFRPQEESANQFIIPTDSQNKFIPESLIQAHASELNEVPLETYSPPKAVLKFDENGKELAQPIPLYPTLNSFGYLVAPPDVLISLESLKALISNNCVKVKEGQFPTKDSQVDCPQKDNFISAIRVRVAGIDTIDQFAEEKIIALAKKITDLTGLKTDVMVGSALQPVLVHIPGKDGIPGMGFAEEDWIKKGVSTTYRKGFTLISSLAALAMVSVGSVLILLMNYQALLSCQDEFLLLYTLGWKKGDVFQRRLLPSMAMQMGIFLILLTILLNVPGVSSLAPSLRTTLILILGIFVYSLVIFYMPYRMIFYKKRELSSEALKTAEESSTIKSDLKIASLLGRMISKPYASSVVTSLGLISSLLMSFFIYLQIKSIEALKLNRLGQVLLSSLSPKINLFGFSTIIFLCVIAAFMFAITFNKNMSSFKLLNMLGWKWKRITLRMVANFMGSYGLGYTFALLLLLILSLWIRPEGTSVLAFLQPFASAALLALVLMSLIALIASLILLVSAGIFSKRILLSGLKKTVLVVILVTATLFTVFAVNKLIKSLQSQQAAILALPSPTPVNMVKTNFYFSNTAQYNLDLKFDPTKELLSGKVRIIFTNTFDVSLSEVVLRLYPNVPSFLSTADQVPLLQVSATRVDGKDITGKLSQSNSVLTLPLPLSLHPGQKALLELDFELKAPLINLKEGSWMTARAFYPILAVYDQTGWRTDVCDYCEKVVFSNMGTYHVTATFPENLRMVTNAPLIGATKQADSTRSNEYQADLLRYFFISFSQDFTIAASNSNGIDIQIATLADQTAADKILDLTIEILNYYDTAFGRYPFDSMTIIAGLSSRSGSIPYSAGGFIFYNFTDPAFEKNLAAFIASSWWGAAVGNDFYTSPWLDTALAEYSGMLYLQANASSSNYEQVLAALQTKAQSGTKPLDSPMSAYAPDGSAYNETVHAKGALTFLDLEKVIGKEKLKSILVEYYLANQYKISTPEALITLIQKEADYDFRTLISQ